jgi:hypothetical protein
MCNDDSENEGGDAAPHADDTSDGYTVGYRKPPKEFRFKPGNKASPRGRRKGSKNRKVIVRELFLERLPVRDGDRKTKISRLEIILTKLLNRAIRDDHRAQVEAIKIAQREGLLTPEQEAEVEKVLSESDKAIIQDYLNRQVKKPSDE